jgi:enoyl-CoA hydratase
MTNQPLIVVERPTAHVAWIVLNRPQVRNAQNTALLYALNDEFDQAARDNTVKVIVLAARGPHFSSGHDLREENQVAALENHQSVGTWCGYSCAGAESTFAIERELYLGLCERWRAIPKPTIAAVQGKVIAGGLMLVWPFDIIVAASDAAFQDNTVAMGVCGVEMFNHPWEVGVRKAKELLFTSDWLSAEDARALGMVNYVVPLSELQPFTLRLAERISQKPAFALKLAKEAVNAAQDSQGRKTALDAAFALHQLCHAHNTLIYGTPMDPGFLSQFSAKVREPGSDNPE